MRREDGIGRKKAQDLTAIKVERVVPNALSGLMKEEYTRHLQIAHGEGWRWLVLHAIPWESPQFPERLHHGTPGWVKNGALFHVRVRSEGPDRNALTRSDNSAQLLAGIRRYHEMGRWYCRVVLLLPDHPHALLAFATTDEMSQIVRGWKRVTARLVGSVWQKNFFDHRIRNETEASETWNYIRRNPVAKGLCASEGEWAHWWAPSQE